MRKDNKSESRNAVAPAAGVGAAAGRAPVVLTITAGAQSCRSAPLSFALARQRLLMREEPQS